MTPPPIKVTQFQAIHFSDDDGHERILLYALGVNGVVYEMAGGTWIALPIDEPHLRKFPEPPSP